MTLPALANIKISVISLGYVGLLLVVFPTSALMGQTEPLFGSQVGLD